MKTKQKNTVAVLDIGTNTFHILIAQLKKSGHSKVIHREKIPVKLGQGGINQGIITPAAIDRAKVAFAYFNELMVLHEVNELKTIATSAVRCAKNGLEFIAMAKDLYNIDIEVIDGNREAELIYKGIKRAVPMDDSPHLIMDIGGGSVEFILCNENDIIWKQSFEIGGQRLVEFFHKTDPILDSELFELHQYLEEKLTPLFNLKASHASFQLVGASGTFDTLCDIYYKEHQIEIEEKRNYHILPKQAYYAIHKELLAKNRAERMAIPGMIEMRVDLIVVSSYLIHFVIEKLQIDKILASRFALKEGVISEMETPINNSNPNI